MSYEKNFESSVIKTVETRLRLNEEEQALVKELCFVFQKATRQAFAGLYRRGESEAQVYQAVKASCGLTAHQTKSAIMEAKGWYARQRAVDQTQLEAGKAGLVKREQTIKETEAQLALLESRIQRHQEQLREWKKLGWPTQELVGVPTKAQREAMHERLAKLMGQHQHKSAWLAQKRRGLAVRQERVRQLEKRIKEGRVSICFGSRKLLAQHPAQRVKGGGVSRQKVKESRNPYAAVQDWREEWEHARGREYVSVGSKDIAFGNGALAYNPFAETLTIRLTETQRLRRESEQGKNTLMAVAEATEKPRNQAKCQREQAERERAARQLVVSQVRFTGYRDAQGDKEAAQRWLVQAASVEGREKGVGLGRGRKKGPTVKGDGVEGEKLTIEEQKPSERKDRSQIPLMGKMVIRKDATGQKRYYLQITVDVGLLEQRRNESKGIVASPMVGRGHGVLGVDFNVLGCAWSVVKPNGSVQSGARGFETWVGKVGLNQGSTAVAIGTMCKKLAGVAKQHQVALAIENLDFARKKSQMGAGTKREHERRYHRMLSSLGTRQFEQGMSRNAQALGLRVYKVNPKYSSLGGFVKFAGKTPLTGLHHQGVFVGVDVAASQWIGRQAVWGEEYKSSSKSKETPTVVGVKWYEERVVARPTRLGGKQRKNASQVGEVGSKETVSKQWRAVAQAFGSVRSQWPARLKKGVGHKRSEQDTGQGVEEALPEQAIRENCGLWGDVGQIMTSQTNRQACTSRTKNNSSGNRVDAK